MTKFLLAVHVLAAIVAVGPVTVAASMFPPAARKVLAAPEDDRSLTVVSTLHRICRVYSAVGVAVPVFGFATAGAMGVMGDPWLIASIVLTVLAAGVLLVLVLPGQEAVLDGPGTEAAALATRRLAMFTGVFNLLWATVTVLMIVRPGSTTGV